MRHEITCLIFFCDFEAQSLVEVFSGVRFMHDQLNRTARFGNNIRYYRSPKPPTSEAFIQINTLYQYPAGLPSGFQVADILTTQLNDSDVMNIPMPLEPVVLAVLVPADQPFDNRLEPMVSDLPTPLVIGFSCFSKCIHLDSSWSRTLSFVIRRTNFTPRVPPAHE